MGRRSVFIAVGNLCENFTSNLKHLSHYVVVKYIVKKRCYGCKITIIAKNRKNDRTIFYCLVKIRSTEEIDLLNSVLSGMDDYLEKYSKIPFETDSE